MTRQNRLNKSQNFSSFSKKSNPSSSLSSSPFSSTTPSLMDSLKQGFGFGMGAELGRKGVDAMISGVTETSQPQTESCQELMDKFAECMRHNQYLTFCQNENEMYEKCKNKINKK